MSDFALEDLTERGENKLLRIDGKKIVDWDHFHDLFSKALGFPGFYGRNMAAWVDCMSSIDYPEDQLTQVHVGKGGTLTIHVENYEYFRKRGQDQWWALLHSSSFVNYRRVDDGGRPVIALSFFK